MKDIKWSYIESFVTDKISAQHAFVKCRRGAYYEDKYEGNKTLCGQLGAHDGDKFVSLNEIKDTLLDEIKACKTCLKIYKKKEYETCKMEWGIKRIHI